MTKLTPTPDYSKLIDAQVQAFIDDTNAAFPAHSANLSVEEQRTLYNAMCQQFRASYPPGVVSADSTLNNDTIADSPACQVPLRRYTPGNANQKAHKVQIVYLHGGGFVVGDLDSHDDVCAEICHQTGYELTSVDYRLAPEHKHPTALSDVLLAIAHIWQEHQQPIVVCGDSAGANLCAAACHAYRGLRIHTGAAPTIAGQVLIYPGLGGDTTKGSYIKHAIAPMLSADDVHFYSDIRSEHDSDLSDPLFAPLLDNNFSELPPSVVISAECDPLCDDGRDYCEKITNAGGKAHWIHEQGLVHGYLRARHRSQRAADSFARIVAAVSALAEETWPYL